MKKKIGTLNILGQAYPVYFSDEKHDPKLVGNNGYTDLDKKIILIDNTISSPFAKHVLVHEIVHAFLFESGLDDQTKDGWARNEEIVDWFALQLPKMSVVMNKVHKSHKQYLKEKKDNAKSQ